MEKTGKRFFAVIEYTPNDPELIAEKKELNLFNKDSLQITGDPNSTSQSNPIKLKTGYGICIDFECGN